MGASIGKSRFRPEYLFKPRSIGVVGAGTALGQSVLQNLRDGGFAGTITTVDRAEDLPTPPDLALITTAPDDAGAAIAAIGQLGTMAAICLTPAPDLATAAQAARVRVMGPSAFGIMVPALKLNATAGPMAAKPGRVALVSQSAALCRSVLDWAEPNGVGFSHVVGLGGAADMGFAITLDWLARDPGTGAILLDIRTIRSRRSFLSAARAAARLRPVVAIRAGARLSDPTGLADRAFNAALRRAGIIRVERLADLLAAAETLTRARPLRTESVAIVTNAVGPGQLAADAALTLNIPIASLTPATRTVLDMRLPATPAGLGVVWTGPDQPIRLAEAASLLSGAAEVGGVVVVMAPTGDADTAAVAGLAASFASLKIPMLAAILGETTAAPHRKFLAEAGVPVFATPEQAMRGFGQLLEQRRARAAARELPDSAVLTIAPDRAAVRAILDTVHAAGRTGLLQHEALAVLNAYGMRTVPTAPALTAAAAATAAIALGFPAVLKLARITRPGARGPGGVVLDLMDGPAVIAAAARLEERRAAQPPVFLVAQPPGFLVQRQMGRAREVRITVQDDLLFGPTIGFGQGGSAADLLDDVAVDLPPLNLTLATQLIGRTRAARTLAELHEQPAADTAGIADALVRVSQLVVDFPEIGGIDVNPVFADADGVRAGDAWIGLRPAGTVGQLAIAPYPAELIEQWQTNGGTLTIRPIRPEDAEAHAALFTRLTPQDVRYRFFSMVRALSPEQIARMTQVDYDREMAFVAVRSIVGGPDQTVGVARLVREPYTPRGEFAVVVEGSMKGQGVGRRLMQRLIDWGRTQEIREIEGQVLAENAPMLAFMRHLGFTLHRSPDDQEIVDASLQLAP